MSDDHSIALAVSLNTQEHMPQFIMECGLDDLGMRQSH